jgi:hypothetical protein
VAARPKIGREKAHGHFVQNDTPSATVLRWLCIKLQGRFFGYGVNPWLRGPETGRGHFDPVCLPPISTSKYEDKAAALKTAAPRLNQTLFQWSALRDGTVLGRTTGVATAVIIFEGVREILAGVRVQIARDLLGSSRGYDGAALRATFRTQIDNPIG